MILIDTNVLVALVDERDGLRARAARDLARTRGRARFATRAVLAETLFLLSRAHHRERLRFLLARANVREVEGVGVDVDAIFDWLEEYGEHEPDFADAELVLLTEHRPGACVWTYDREFWSTWRRKDGRRVPLFVEAPAR